jgi:hypothetical protein
MDCMTASGSHSCNGQTAAGLPVKGPFEKASTMKTGMFMSLELMMNTIYPSQRYGSTGAECLYANGLSQAGIPL